MKRSMSRICAMLILIFLFIKPVYAESVLFHNDYEAIERAAKSMFLVEIIGEEEQVIGTGSGFVAFDRNVFITNYHVIEDAIALRIYSDGYRESYELKNVIAADADLDIAIMEFAEGKDFDALEVEPEYKLLRGQTVTAIGSPEGVLNTVTTGNISSLLSYNDQIFRIQFTAPISHGSSGGALFNEDGKVIGLVFAMHLEGENMNYAIPIQYVVDLYENAITYDPKALIKYNKLDHYVGAPQNVTAFLTENGSVEVGWDVVDGAEKYQVYCSNGQGEDRPIAYRVVKEGKKRGIIWDTKPSWGEKCYYYVIAQRANDKSKKSELAEVKIPPKPTPPPTPIPTLKPTPSPTPIPVLPNGIEDGYSEGVSGVGILLIKQRLQELGYYKSDAELSNAYNAVMSERIKLFKRDHGIQGEGNTLDYNTLLVLFSDDARETYRFNGAPTRKPLPTVKPTSEPIVTLIIPDGSYMEWNFLSGNLFKFHLQVKNISTSKRIEAFELYCYPVDVWGERLIEDNEVYISTTPKIIDPGKTVYSDYITISDASNISEIYVGIHKIKYSDGTIKIIPDRKIEYACWTIE